VNARPDGAATPVAGGASGGEAGPFHPGGRFLRVFDGQSYNAVSWPDRARLYTCFNPPQRLPVRHDIAVRSEYATHAGYADSGRFFAAVALNERGQEIRLWDAWGGEVRSRLQIPAGSSIKWSGRVLSANAERVALILDGGVTQHSRVRPALATFRAPGHPDGVRYVRTRPDGSALAIEGERRTDSRDSIRLWSTSEQPHDLQAPIDVGINAISSAAIDSLSWSPDGQWLVIRRFLEVSRQLIDDWGLAALVRQPPDLQHQRSPDWVAGPPAPSLQASPVTREHIRRRRRNVPGVA
jgi:WD40 repeat protein